jgi:dTDP-4-amino-4,6-dideoxygalactose transaminase
MLYRVSQPHIGVDERRLVYEAINEGMISHVGKNVEHFENAMAKVHKMKYAVSCNSGTNALHIALEALGIKKGDEVIVPEFTMIATAYAVSYVGATPVFVDCGEGLNIDTSLIEEKITPRTRAIIPVHIYGRQCNMEHIMEIAKKHKLFVVEDCAEAHGIIPQGDIACYSFFANKIITTGEGGMCLTNRVRYRDRLVRQANMAFDPQHTFLHTVVAHNYRMTNLQASVGLGQTLHIHETLYKRKLIEKWYNDMLPRRIQMPKREVLWMYDIILDSEEERDGLTAFLKNQKIETRLFFKPMSMQPPYRGEYKHLKAYDFSRRGMYLPTYTDLTIGDVVYICDAVFRYFQPNRDSRGHRFSLQDELNELSSQG